jgi:crossover junction endodeoxyribonuclease RuvC
MTEKNYKAKESIILGIDPGTNRIGFGLIKSNYKSAIFIETGLIIESYKNNNFKLNKIFQYIIEIIDQYIPNELAIETTFIGTNIQSTIKLSIVQGVVLSAGFYKKIPITKYTPKSIKMSITGTGIASKEQVTYMLNKILFFKNKYLLHYNDASDGLAIAVCHHLNIYTRIN